MADTLTSREICRLVKSRRERRISQGLLASRLGMTQRSLSRRETGRIAESAEWWGTYEKAMQLIATQRAII